MSSDEDAADLMESFKKGARTTPTPPTRKQPSVSPGMFFSDESSADDEVISQDTSSGTARRLLAVQLPPVRSKKGFVYYEPREEIEAIVLEYSRKGDVMYKAKLLSGHIREVSGICTEGESAATALGY